MSNELTMPTTDGIRAAAEKLPKDLKANALLLLEEMSTVVEGLGDSDKVWYPTRLRIVQGTTKTKELDNPKQAMKGHLIVGNTVVGEELKVHAIRLWNSRTLMNPDVDKANVLCSSPDGRNGTRYGRCGGDHCLYAKYDKDSEKAVPCRTNLVSILLTTDCRHMLQFEFYRLASDIGKDFKSMLGKMGPEYWARPLSFKTEENEKKDTVMSPAITRSDDPAASGAVHDFIKAVGLYWADRRRYELDRHENFIEDRKARNVAPDRATPDDVRRITVAQVAAGEHEDGGIDL